MVICHDGRVQGLLSIRVCCIMTSDHAQHHTSGAIGQLASESTTGCPWQTQKREGGNLDVLLPRRRRQETRRLTLVLLASSQLTSSS